jgi:hypothetical protein
MMFNRLSALGERRQGIRVIAGDPRVEHPLKQ